MISIYHLFGLHHLSCSFLPPLSGTTNSVLSLVTLISSVFALSISNSLQVLYPNFRNKSFMYKTVVFFPRLYIDALWMFEPSEQEKMLILKGRQKPNTLISKRFLFRRRIQKMKIDFNNISLSCNQKHHFCTDTIFKETAGWSLSYLEKESTNFPDICNF